jgi:hypothetical protein
MLVALERLRKGTPGSIASTEECMKSETLRMSVVAGVAFLAMMPSAARAVTITDDGSVVFFDNFESGNFNNPTGGSWVFVQNGVTVTNAAVPGAFQGNDYVELFRDAVSNGGSLNALIGTNNGNGITSGEVLLRMMVYIPKNADADARAQFILDSGTRNSGSANFNTARAWIRPNGAGFVETVGAGFATTETTVPYATDVWQEWDLDYVVGASTFGFSVDGVSRSGITSLTSGSVDFVEINNGVASSGSIFVDAVLPASTGGPDSGVPEPSTVGCGALGFAALWRRYRRRQL